MTEQERKRALAMARKVFKQLAPIPRREKYEIIDLLADLGRREILDEIHGRRAAR